MVGFQPFLAPELGYGEAVHHVMRATPSTSEGIGIHRMPIWIGSSTVRWQQAGA
jgi:hypothetical protein